MDQQTQRINRKPDFVGNLEVPVWINVDKNGQQYLSLKIAGTTVNCFPKIERLKPQELPVQPRPSQYPAPLRS